MAPHAKTQQTCKNHTTRLKIIATAFQHTNQFMHASCICCIQPGVVCTYAWDTCVMITEMNRSQLSSGPILLGNLLLNGTMNCILEKFTVPKQIT